MAVANILLVFRCGGASQETAAERAERDETDAQFAHGRQDFGLDIACP